MGEKAAAGQLGWGSSHFFPSGWLCFKERKRTTKKEGNNCMPATPNLTRQIVRMWSPPYQQPPRKILAWLFSIAVLTNPELWLQGDLSLSLIFGARFWRWEIDGRWKICLLSFVPKIIYPKMQCWVLCFANNEPWNLFSYYLEAFFWEHSWTFHTCDDWGSLHMIEGPVIGRGHFRENDSFQNGFLPIGPKSSRSKVFKVIFSNAIVLCGPVLVVWTFVACIRDPK